VHSKKEGHRIQSERMPTVQMNISMPPRMARFIRSKVRAGEYTNVSEAVRDAVRHMQAAEVSTRGRAAANGDITDRLTPRERQAIRQRVQLGIRDIEEGRFEEFDEKGLRAYFAGITERGKKRLAAVSARKTA
jgi:putative addiction module CopG family antidote